MLTHIIEKVTKKSNFQITRADKIGKSGVNTTQIINHLNNADIVIADLAGLNPNVFYELGIRHAVNKPVILIHSPENRLPFDISVVRSIKLNIHDLDSVESCKTELKKQIDAILEDPDDWESPVSLTVNIQKLKTSDGLVEKGLSEIIDNVQSLRSDVARLQEEFTTSPMKVKSFFPRPAGYTFEYPDMNNKFIKPITTSIDLDETSKFKTIIQDDGTIGFIRMKSEEE